MNMNCTYYIHKCRRVRILNTLDGHVSQSFSPYLEPSSDSQMSNAIEELDPQEVVNYIESRLRAGFNAMLAAKASVKAQTIYEGLLVELVSLVDHAKSRFLTS
jgi:hypothetical protein